MNQTPQIRSTSSRNLQRQENVSSSNAETAISLTRQQCPLLGESMADSGAHEDCCSIMINAWRQERETSKKLRKEKIAMQDQAKNLSRQASVLTYLLKCEQNRVQTSSELINKMIAELEDHIAERNTLVEEKNALVEKVKDLETKLGNSHEDFELYSTKHNATKKKCSIMEKELKVARAELAKLREDKHKITEQLSAQESSITAKNTVIKQFDLMTAKLQEKLDSQAEHFKKEMELESRESRMVVDEKSRGEVVASDHEALLARITELENTVKYKDTLIESLQFTLTSNKDVIVELKNQLSKPVLRNSSSGWSNFFVNFGVAILSRLVEMPSHIYYFLFVADDDEDDAKR